MNWSENKTKFYFIIIVVLIIVILLQKCGGGGGKVTSQNDTIKIVDTTYSTIVQKVPTYVPQWHTRIEYVHDTTKTRDTAYVIVIGRAHV